MAVSTEAVDRTPFAARPAPPRFMIVSDLDNTMVDHKDPMHTSLLRFNALWASEYAHDSLLVFSTGRSPTAFKELKSHVPLLTPGITILSVGTEILYGEKMVPDAGWLKFLDEGWNRDIVVEEATKFHELRWQADSEQRPHKVSFNVEKAEAPKIIEPLTARLNERGLKAKIIYSGGYDLDILPESAGKGQALAYLLRKLKEEDRLPKNTLACGDSGNDQELFTVEGANGVIVGNAMEELVQWFEGQKDTSHLFRATETCASGIIQAMQHFKFEPSVSPRDLPIEPIGKDVLDTSGPPSGKVPGVVAVQREIVMSNIVLERWLNGELEHGILQGSPAVLAEDFTLTHPSGKELTKEEFASQLDAVYGRQRGKGWKIWIDRLVTKEVAPGAFLARYSACEQLAGGERVIRVSSAILRPKDGTPNGVEWIHVHETFQEGEGH